LLPLQELYKVNTVWCHGVYVPKFIGRYPIKFNILVWSWGLCVRFAGCLLVYCFCFACVVWVAEGQLKKSKQSSKQASILQTGHITLSSAPEQQLENHRYVLLHFRCMHLSITSTFIKLQPTNGIPDPQTETTKLYATKKHTKNTHTRPTWHSTHLITNLDNTRHLILRTQIPPNLHITFYIFTAPNTTGSDHCIIPLSSWWWA